MTIDRHMKRDNNAGTSETTLRLSYRYFLNVLAVTATASANSVANGRITNVGCRLNGSDRYTTHVSTTSGIAAFFA